jgi:type III restriction enzyme
MTTPLQINLYHQLSQQVQSWRSEGYPVNDYPAVAEILDWAKEPEGSGFRLRVPQLRALETYWYLRLIEKTPHIVGLYRHLFPKNSDLLSALGLTHKDINDYVLDYGLESLFNRIKTDDDFVRQFHLEALRETLILPYPSYILALASSKPREK